MGLHSDSSIRIGLMSKISNALDAFTALDISHTENDEHIFASMLIRRCRQSVEDMRVKMHARLSLSVLDEEIGLTEDVCYFMVVAHCDDKLGEVIPITQGIPFIAGFPLYNHRGVSCNDLNPSELDDTFATLFQYVRAIEWTDLESSTRLITGLHLRASQLLVDSKLEEYHSRRALWSCAIARLKVFVLQTLQWKLHRNNIISVNPDTHPTPGALDTNPQARCSTREDLMHFLMDAVRNWNGPRLRESLARANAKRLIRPDEMGRTAAFRGGNPFPRARGTTDSTEDALHGLDLEALLRCSIERCVGSLLQLRELLILKLLHNALEAIDICDFMGRHIQLQSLRDCEYLRQSDINTHVHRIWELPGGWVTVPHRNSYTYDNPGHLEDAVCHWYDTHFKGTDPLKLNRP